MRNNSESVLQTLQQVEKSKNEMEDDVEMKSMLSVIADSARVEVWFVNQDLLELLPIHVQDSIIGRLRTH